MAGVPRRGLHRRVRRGGRAEYATTKGLAFSIALGSVPTHPAMHPYLAVASLNLRVGTNFAGPFLVERCLSESAPRARYLENAHAEVCFVAAAPVGGAPSLAPAPRTIAGLKRRIQGKRPPVWRSRQPTTRSVSRWPRQRVVHDLALHGEAATYLAFFEVHGPSIARYCALRLRPFQPLTLRVDHTAPSNLARDSRKSAKPPRIPPGHITLYARHRQSPGGRCGRRRCRL